MHYRAEGHSIMLNSYFLLSILLICQTDVARCELFFFFLMIRHPPISTLFPYPPLFRSAERRPPVGRADTPPGERADGGAGLAAAHHPADPAHHVAEAAERAEAAGHRRHRSAHVRRQ